MVSKTMASYSEISSGPATGVPDAESLLSSSGLFSDLLQLEDSELETTLLSDPPTVTSLGTTAAPMRRKPATSTATMEKRRMKTQAIRKMMKAMRKSEQVDLCFLVDCTGSMQPWISSVKSGIQELHDALYRKYDGCDLRVAFVRYTDYDQPEGSRTTWIDFTKSPSDFQRFVSSIVASGGGDDAEDVMGGFNVALNTLSWRKECITKVLIHIADCPCHGRKYHDGMSDNYPEGDPAHIHPSEIMQEVARQEIQYWFGYIQRQYTDKMVYVFNEHLKQASERQLMISQFEAINPASVVDKVFESVVASIDLTTMTLTGKKHPIRSYSIDKSNPDWSTVKEHPTKYLTTIPEECEEEEVTHSSHPSTATLLKVAAQPFDEGAVSIVFHSQDPGTGNRYVIKQSKREGKEYNSQNYYETVVIRQMEAMRYANAFNEEKPKNVRSVQFASVQVIQVERSGNPELGLLEPFIDGKYEKFNSNNGWVSKSPYSDTLQAFSHYTWEESKKKLVIVDLQGVASEKELILTDPAIHHVDNMKFGPTNFGMVGIKKFFVSHKCTDICRKMGLKAYNIRRGERK